METARNQKSVSAAATEANRRVRLACCRCEAVVVGCSWYFSMDELAARLEVIKERRAEGPKAAVLRTAMPASTDKSVM